MSAENMPKYALFVGYSSRDHVVSAYLNGPTRNFQVDPFTPLIYNSTQISLYDIYETVKRMPSLSFNNESYLILLGGTAEYGMDINGASQGFTYNFTHVPLSITDGHISYVGFPETRRQFPNNSNNYLTELWKNVNLVSDRVEVVVFNGEFEQYTHRYQFLDLAEQLKERFPNIRYATTTTMFSPPTEFSRVILDCPHRPGQHTVDYIIPDTYTPEYGTFRRTLELYDV